MTRTEQFLAVCTIVLAGACSGEFELDQPGLGGTPRSGADGGVATGGGAAYFRANILPFMTSPRPKGACALCHQGTNPVDGPDFLGANAELNYTTLMNSARLIGASAATSVFYTKGDHAGNAFVDEELARISIWIGMEQ